MRLKKSVITVAALVVFALSFWACAPSKPVTSKEVKPAPVIVDKKTNQ